MKFRRQRQDLSLAISVPTVADAIDLVERRKDEVMRSFTLGVRSGAEGRVRARVAIASRYHARPQFRGQLMAYGQATALRGVIFESRAEVLIPRIYAAVAAIMTGFAVAIVKSGDPIDPGILICSGSAVVLALFAYTLGRLRLTLFARDVAELEKSIEYLVRPKE